MLLAIALLLGACGSVTGQTPGETATPTARAAIELPPTQVTVENTAQARVASPTALPAPELTSTPVVAPTPTPEPRPVIVQVPTIQPTASPVPTLTPEPKPTATPVVKGTSEKIDRATELKLIKSGYDAINKYLYKEPDTAVLLKASLEEISRMTGVAAPSVSFGKEADQNWETFNQAFEKILDQAKTFVYPKNQLAHRVVNVMAEAIGDEHTYFLEASGYQSRQDLLSGNNSSIGFGVVVTTQDNKAYITRVVSGSPAEQAGVRPGDQVVQYDDLKIDAKNWTSIREAKENETHRFTMLRLGSPQPLLLNIAKKKYNLPTVEYRLINGHIGYIGIRDFFVNVADETDRAMIELRKQGADSWILDVRENPGGVNVEMLVGRFVAGGEIMGYTTERKRREPVKVSPDLTGGPNKGQPFAPILPLTVLMDDVSASSSEMLALAARDFQLGPLIGVKTAGALGHTAAYPLGDGSAISVTVDVYESKSGEKDNGLGVKPDQEVKRTIADLVAGRDPQLAAGVEYLEKLIAKK